MDSPQVGEWVWLYTPTSDPTKGRKLSVHLTGPWEVTGQPSATLRTITTRGEWATTTRTITVSVNRLKRYIGKRTITRQATPIDISQVAFDMTDEFLEGPLLPLSNTEQQGQPIGRNPSNSREQPSKQPSNDRTTRTDWRK